MRLFLSSFFDLDRGGDAMAQRKQTRPGDKIRVGDLVRYRRVSGWADARVVEDHGDIGVNGRRLLQLRPLREHANGDVVWPAEELILAE